ncbi:glycoside hydrolase family 43 protein [Agriterribacter sp.]|uniref:glycoside hydrolase family 43 protein n=1 Tax=Agriterribacter sp. TaxID=2821509 RepID=UPI002BB799DA|nr:glycoside hydrolase family 43 protein [Agriterribacter sp.]HRO44344.1 glycoside hydrolase family 43 protein [Agriterribacter sp.]HRQ16660.1 glycoside hydrolase family 43 protein [Agriterribacter sp.]
MYPIIYYVLALLLCSVKEEIRPATEQIYLADPTIFQEGGKYYLYGTDGFNADSGFNAYVSEDMQHWGKSLTGNQRALAKGASFGTKGFWAPQVFRHHNQYYMAYTANEHIAMACSDNPAGPYKQTQLKALEAPVKQIDPFVFKDDDGKLYLYHVRLQNGNRIFVAELKNDLSGILPNTLRECISAVNDPQPWENMQQVKWTVTEGPTVIKRGNLYYMLYSANDFRNPDYAVGYAVADNPYGPWKKYEGNPIISKKVTGANGSGHGDIIMNKAGDYYYVFHTHFSNEKVAPRKTAMIKIRFTDNGSNESMEADTLSFEYLKYGQ